MFSVKVRRSGRDLFSLSTQINRNGLPNMIESDFKFPTYDELLPSHLFISAIFYFYTCRICFTAINILAYSTVPYLFHIPYLSDAETTTDLYL